MTRRPRRNHTGTCKAKVALDAIKGEKTLLELASQHDVHANQITQWKSQLLEGAAGVFGEAKTDQPAPVDLKTLHAKIGELTLENDFSKGRSPRRDFCAPDNDRPPARSSPQETSRSARHQPQQRLLSRSSGASRRSVADALHRRVPSELSLCG